MIITCYCYLILLCR